MKDIDYVIQNVTSEIIAGYENTCSDEDYSLTEAKEKFYDNMQDLIERIHEMIRENEERGWGPKGIRFQGNKLLDKKIEEHIRKEYNYLIKKDNTFDFSKSWVYN